MPTADEYRRLAAECLTLAANVSDEFRGIYVALAQGWANLANYLDGRPVAEIVPDRPGDGEGYNL